MNIREEVKALAKELEEERMLLNKKPKTPFLKTAIKVGEKKLIKLQKILSKSKSR